jgi:exonuclease SbcC
LITAQNNYDANLTHKPKIKEDENFDSIVQNVTKLEEENQSVIENIGTFRERLNAFEENKKNRDKLLVEYQKKEVEYNKWNKLNSIFGSADGATFRKIAQSYVLANLINSANHHLKVLTDRYRLRVEPGSFVIEVEDAYQGFVSRAVTTISGGESFIISLSLALALSDMGQGLSLDILFIDEGFGSLSKDVLQTAIDTLSLLHGKVGKRVGIISHVEELQEKIPVQIQVNKEGNSSCSTVEVVNRAMR